MSRLERELVIMPRSRGYAHLPVIAVTQGMAADENGEVVDLIQRAKEYEKPALWVTDDAGELLSYLHSVGRYDRGWKFQATGAEQSSKREDGRVAECKMTLRRFTFEPPDDKGKRHHRMHLVHVAPPMIGGTVKDLLTYGAAMVKWCDDQDLPIPTSLTGIASSLLRDSRFWPRARGRVPRATNDSVRVHLPGVYSESGTDKKFFRNITSVDLTSAYHVSATETPVPDSTNLYAWGHFTNARESPIWIGKEDHDFRDAISEYGLFALRVSPKTQVHRWTVPATRHKKDTVFLWSSEIAAAIEDGLIIEGIVAGWTSPFADEGLPKYAQWAREELKQNRDKPWLKVALLSAYGLLGAQTQDITCHIGPRGVDVSYVGPQTYTGRAYTLTDLAPVTANVASLGVIQADIRTRMLTLAKSLERAHCDVTHIHADALHVTGDLPLLDRGTHSQHLTRLVYVDDNSWISDQTEHLPGRFGKQRALEHRRRLLQIRQRSRPLAQV